MMNISSRTNTSPDQKGNTHCVFDNKIRRGSILRIIIMVDLSVSIFITADLSVFIFKVKGGM